MTDLVQAIAQAILAVGAVIGGAWGGLTYRRSRRTDAARWVNDIFNTFYRDPMLLAAREVFEYGYWESVRQAVEVRVLDRHVQLKAHQMSIIRDIDLILNTLEQLIYLQAETHIRDTDRDVFFAYWFGILAYPSRAGLRRYLAKCGFERCAELVGAQSSDAVALHPMIGESMGLLKASEVELPLEKGALGLKFTDDRSLRLFGQFELADSSTVRLLDQFFKYDPANPESSPTIRVCLPVPGGPNDVWVYLDSNAVAELPRVLPEAGGGYQHP